MGGDTMLEIDFSCVETQHGAVPARRVRIAEERTILVELEDRFKHQPMKNWVRRTLEGLVDIDRVLSWLDDDRRDEDEESAQISLGGRSPGIGGGETTAATGCDREARA
jgi:hypothetical protein